MKMIRLGMWLSVVGLVYAGMIGSAYASVKPPAGNSQVQTAPQGDCVPWTVAEEYLKGQGAELFVTGLSQEGEHAAQFWANDESWWLIVIRSSDRRTCIRLAGGDWIILKTALSGRDS